MKNIFTPGSNNNYFILLISYVAYPLSILLYKFHRTPNQITLLSFLIAIASCAFLLNGYLYQFIFLWVLSSILDFCDGQLARISGRINRTAFNADHISDLIKIFMVLLSNAINFNNSILWILFCFLIFLFPFFSLLNTSYSYHFINLKIKNKKFISMKNKLLNKILSNIISIFFKIDGHTLFLFPFLAITQELAFFILLYLCIVLLLNILRYSYLLIKIKNK